MSALRTTRPTMRDVAVRAGVSLKTVSRVINAEPGVAVATAARVGDAIDELGFQRNDLARSLRQGVTSSTLGLVIEDVANPFYSAIAQAVEAAARDRGYLLITTSCASRDHEYLVRETAGGTPVVFLDRPPVGIAADCVLLDNLGGARTAVEHLLAHGHERIAAIGDTPELYTAAERLAGYRDALAAAGVPVREELVRLGTHDTQQAETVVRELLSLPADRRPTALFAGNNRNAIGALRALRSSEHHPALVGFDDFELADLLAVPATVVRHDSQRMGAHAAGLAFARLDGADHPAETVVVPTELVVRGSGEVPP
jgi:LacI family transcriptional regulator